MILLSKIEICLKEYDEYAGNDWIMIIIMLFSLYTSMYRIFLFNAFPGGLLNLLAVL